MQANLKDNTSDAFTINSDIKETLYRHLESQQTEWRGLSFTTGRLYRDTKGAPLINLCTSYRIIKNIYTQAQMILTLNLSFSVSILVIATTIFLVNNIPGVLLYWLLVLLLKTGCCTIANCSHKTYHGPYKA